MYCTQPLLYCTVVVCCMVSMLRGVYTHKIPYTHSYGRYFNCGRSVMSITAYWMLCTVYKISDVSFYESNSIVSFAVCTLHVWHAHWWPHSTSDVNKRLCCLMRHLLQLQWNRWRSVRAASMRNMYTFSNNKLRKRVCFSIHTISSMCIMCKVWSNSVFRLVWNKSTFSKHTYWNNLYIHTYVGLLIQRCPDFTGCFCLWGNLKIASNLIVSLKLTGSNLHDVTKFSPQNFRSLALPQIELQLV